MAKTTVTYPRYAKVINTTKWEQKHGVVYDTSKTPRWVTGWHPSAYWGTYYKIWYAEATKEEFLTQDQVGICDE